MKRIILLTIMVVVSTVGYGFAETQSGCTDDAQNAVCKKDIAMMGMGMMGGMAGHGDHGMGSGDSEHDMADHSQAGHGEMMQWDGMSKHMIPMMKSVNGMTLRMSEIMGKGMTPETMKRMSEVMRDMSEQMAGMSDMMQKGSASEEEMHQVHMKISASEKALEHVH